MCCFYWIVATNTIVILITVLKIYHPKVIDTALVFKYPNARKPRRASLNNLCKVKSIINGFSSLVLGDNITKRLTFSRNFFFFFYQSILGYEVRKAGVSHDCVNDATAAMKLALAVIEKRANTTIPPSKEVCRK